MTYDAIVIGAGGVGSAALYHVARRGARVLGLDRFPPAHDRGSSHGHTRIIRQAYFEHSDYVPLLMRAYELWAELETARQETLLHKVGLLQIGPPDGVVVPGVLASARRHGLNVERFSAEETSRRFPGFHVPDECEGVFEREAGYLLVERCVLGHLAEAEKLGAEIRTGESVLRWSAHRGGVTVETDRATYSAGQLIISAGAWARELLSDLGIRLRVLRKHLYWQECQDERYRQERGCPTFLYETAQGCYYGFPALDDWGVKAGEHSGGTEVADLMHDDRSVDPTDCERVAAFLTTHLPSVSTRVKRHTTCFYTMSPDEQFLVDRHPEYERVCFAAGLSGHGFKFTCVLGEILADLALSGRTNHPIEFLRVARPGLRGGETESTTGSPRQA